MAQFKSIAPVMKRGTLMSPNIAQAAKSATPMSPIFCPATQNDPPTSPNTMRLSLVTLHSRQMFLFLFVSLFVSFSDSFCDYFFLFQSFLSVPLSFCEFSCVFFFRYFYFGLFSHPTVMFLNLRNSAVSQLNFP